MSDDLNSLKRKLSFLKKKTREDSIPLKTPKEKPVHFSMPGWEKKGEFSYIYTYREEFSPLDSLMENSVIFDHKVDSRELLFFDTETTGLSGGAGNRIFLFALGLFRGNQLEVNQFFLSDYPGEMEFLDLILSYLSEDKIYVSYNGKTFDSYLFKSRVDLFSREFPIKNQLDLLHYSRRLWKRQIGSCSLSHIEEEILNITRDHDIPGYRVPSAYFDFLRNGNLDDLSLVFSHNLQDVISLALLLREILMITQKDDSAESLFSVKDSPAANLADPAALSRIYHSNDPHHALEILEAAHEKGDARAGGILARQFKRLGCFTKAYEIWESLFKKQPSPYWAIELAKLSEHQNKDYQQALFWVEKAFTSQNFILANVRQDLRTRRSRLNRKIEIQQESGNKI